MKKLYDQGLLIAPTQVYSEDKATHEHKHWDSDIHCPTDRDKIKIYDYQNIHIDICHTCKGLWLDDGELKKLWKGETTAEYFGTWIADLFGSSILSVLDV